MHWKKTAWNCNKANDITKQEKIPTRWIWFRSDLCHQTGYRYFISFIWNSSSLSVNFCWNSFHEIIEYNRGFFRNPIERVAKFLNEKHPRKYRMYNLCSERTYDTHHFIGCTVERIMIDDHNVPRYFLMVLFLHASNHNDSF